MTTISSLGVGSGLDSESIISALLAVEKKPIDLLATEKTEMSTKLSSVGKLKSLAAAMRDAAESLTSTSFWKTKTLTSADSTVVSGSVSTSGVSGNYNVSVQSLATAQTVTSGKFASSSSTLSEGTLTLQLGTWTGTSFAAKSGSSAVSIPIGSGDTSLTSIRDKINAAGAGVTATIVNDAGGARLSLRSTDTGAENGFRLTAAETSDDGDPATGLSALTYNPADAANSVLTRNLAAGNAKATINGIAVESATNTFTDVVDGLTLTVGKVSSSDVLVTVGDDTDAMEKGIKTFVSAFNDLAKYIKDQTKYDATSKKGGPLQGDRTTVGFLNQLRNVLNTSSSASSTWGRLSDIGITMGTDGTLSIKSSTLSEALKKPAELSKLLATDASTTDASGFMDRFRDLGDSVLDVEGSLQMSEDQINASITRNQKRQDQLNDRLTNYEARLRAQYEALDTQMASLNSLSSYVSQQISVLNSSS